MIPLEIIFSDERMLNDDEYDIDCTDERKIRKCRRHFLSLTG